MAATWTPERKFRLTTWSSLTLLDSDLTGEGDLAFTNEYQGALILATAIPAYVGHEAGDVQYYPRIGWAAFVTDEYQDERHVLHWVNHELTVIPPLVDHLHYKLDLGVEVSVYGAKGVLVTLPTITHAVVEYDAVVGPHGVTTRWTYTCPADKVARVKRLAGRILRVTVATALGAPQVVVLYNGVSDAFNLALFSNAVSAMLTQSDAPHFLLLPGETLQAKTVDNSTGGTVWYNVLAVIDEYPAQTNVLAL